MRSLLRRCLRHHGTAAAYLALVLALGGTAYAAAYITGADIVDGSITSADIGAGQVTESTLATNAVSARTLGTNSVYSGNITDGMIIGKDISDGALTSREVADNSLTGKDLKLNLITRTATSAYAPGNKNVTATCPAGYTAISGGAEIPDEYDDAPGDVEISSRPTASTNGGPPTGWRAEGEIIKYRPTPEYSFYWDDGNDYLVNYTLNQRYSYYKAAWELKAWAVCAAL